MSSDVKYYQSAAIAVISLNSVSFIALAFIIIIYAVRWKKINSFPMRLSFYLCISCLVQNLYVLIFNPIDVYKDQVNAGGASASNYCIFQSWVKTSFDLSSILWTTLIIYSSYASVVLRINLQSKELFYLMIGFLFPMLVSLIPIFIRLYGYDTYYCWFSSDNLSVKFWLKMLYFFFPLWFLFIFNCALSITTYRKLLSLGLGERQLNIFKKLMLFPLILLVTGLFATIDVIYIYVTSDFVFWLDMLSMVLLSSYGLFNSLAYGFNPLIRQQILMMLGIKKIEQIAVDRTSHTTSSRQTEKLSQLINI